MSLKSLFESQYISKEALDNLKHYKYGAVDKSPLSKYILQPYWTWCVQFFPLWMAPNLITLVGLSFVIFNVIMTCFIVPDLVGPTHWLVYVSYCLGLWLYSTFDNVDGKQARRTNSSSPLGELFDHGCDALNCAVTLPLAAAMSIGHTQQTVYLAVVITVAFFVTTWEEYNTGVLYLGYINGPTEGLFLACSISLVSAAFGPHIWKITLLDVGNFVPKKWHSFLPTTKLNSLDLIVLQMTMLLFFFQIPLTLGNIYAECKKKKTSFVATLVQPIPILIWAASIYFWTVGPDSSFVKNQHTILFLLFTGFVFGRIATKVILAYVTKMPYPMFTSMLFPLVFGAVMAHGSTMFGVKLMTSEREHIYLWACFVFVTVAYLQWALLVIEKFCAHLNIKCLTIPYPAKKTN